MGELVRASESSCSAERAGTRYLVKQHANAGGLCSSTRRRGTFRCVFCLSVLYLSVVCLSASAGGRRVRARVETAGTGEERESWGSAPQPYPFP